MFIWVFFALFRVRGEKEWKKQQVNSASVSSTLFAARFLQIVSNSSGRSALIGSETRCFANGIKHFTTSSSCSSKNGSPYRIKNNQRRQYDQEKERDIEKESERERENSEIERAKRAEKRLADDHDMTGDYSTWSRAPSASFNSTFFFRFSS